MSIIDFLRRISRYLRPYRLQVTFLCATMILDSCFESSLPLFIKYIIDQAVIPRNMDILILVMLAIGGVVLLVSITRLARDYFYARFGTSMLNDLRILMFDQLQRLSMGFYARCQVGDVMSRFSNDLNSVENAVVNALPVAFMGITEMLFTVGFMFALQWQLALLSILGVLLSFGAARLMEPRATAASYAQKEELGRNSAVIHENLTAPAVIRGFSLQRRLVEDFRMEIRKLYHVTTRANLLAYILERIPNIGILLFGLLVICGGALMAFHGTLSIGGLMAFYGLFFSLTACVSSLTWVIPQVLHAGAGMRRIEDLLSEVPHIVDLPGAAELPPFQHEIAFQNVSFSYTGDQVNLDNVSLTISRGEKVAFVGPSGSGKSTILKLVVRFYDPTKGKVTMDGRDLRTGTIESIRGQMAIVFQDNFLFNTTLRDNIRMGKHDATDEEIIRAAIQAEIHEFITSLPDGYETLAGERGEHLSVGQRQRIGIARALLRDPAVLILDEATSALDTPAEDVIRNNIFDHANGRTILSVTHRLSMAMKADRIYVLDGGYLKENGTHAALLAAGGLYAQMWKKHGSSQTHHAVDLIEMEPSLLRTIPILEKLDDAVVSMLTRAFVIEHHPEDRMVFGQGDPGDRFYIILRGMVSISRTSPSGEKRNLAVLGEGDYFGEVALLNHSPRKVSIHTNTPCVFLTLTRSHFQEFLSSAPTALQMVHGSLTERGNIQRDSPEGGSMEKTGPGIPIPQTLPPMWERHSTLKIDPYVFSAKFPPFCDHGRCRSRCCKGGVWIDLEERELLLRNAKCFMPYLRPEAVDLPSWFDNMEADPDYPSGVAVGTGVVGGYCVFYNHTYGCCLQKAASDLGLHEWSFKPRYCVMFPLLVDDGTITVGDDMKGIWCLVPENRTHPVLSAVEREVNFLFPGEVARKLLNKSCTQCK